MELAIDVTTVPDLENNDDEPTAGEAVEHPVPADPNPEHVRVASELTTTPWTRALRRKRQDGGDDPLLVFSR